ncbi:hypothetical protein TTHERM_000554539 (macronuclear) [Tetrahymena thermophila SB210]|uniref:Uncharacterized protein n=1 Tax=Tetrahymena thermophila (strain SB210) TaxID=312017 RepID=W7XGH4_TETTS|nr:hypothetical protein TTHERM_000554539 [Tetrahymena thermophila SB210]EWS76088.1 hypothetical protein TTHERM_000554539 [Tetrahymena thermophila SB210]|eukprot:XP_012651395.1 hypothetical protein TTHERM_000554539 [Tetrahymena thermophila SB210]
MGLYETLFNSLKLNNQKNNQLISIKADFGNTTQQLLVAGNELKNVERQNFESY